MNKKYLGTVIIIIFVFIISTLVGCSNENSDEKEAIQVATKYKEIEYKVDDYRKVTLPEDIQAKADETKPYVTNDFYNSQMANRVTGLSLQIAQSEKSSIKADKIHLESAQDEENGVMSLNYDLVLVRTDDQGTSKEIKITGVLTMIKVNEEWKVKNEVNHNLNEIFDLAQAKETSIDIGDAVGKTEDSFKKLDGIATTASSFDGKKDVKFRLMVEGNLTETEAT